MWKNEKVTLTKFFYVKSTVALTNKTQRIEILDDEKEMKQNDFQNNFIKYFENDFQNDMR